MGAVASLLKNKEQLVEAGQRIQDRLEAMRVTGESGGGAVRATVTGKFGVVSIEMGGAVTSGLGADDQSREMAQALIVEAVNDAIERAKRATQELIAEEARNLGVPELADKLGGLLT
ncbi:MAG: YbaB/EbfC family nucleoid-associated protein [Phycisphaerales bacterium]